MKIDGGLEAMQLRIAVDYVSEFGNLAKAANTLIVPADLSDVASMIALATKAFERTKDSGPPPPASRPR